MVAPQLLELLVKVRILVRQPNKCVYVYLTDYPGKPDNEKGKWRKKADSIESDII